MIRPYRESISSIVVTNLPLRVALPIGSHPEIIPALTHEAILSIDAGRHYYRNGARVELLLIHRLFPPFNGYSK